MCIRDSYVINKISYGLVENESVDRILMKDAILCTFQLSSSAIANSVNFDNLLPVSYTHLDVYKRQGLD